MPKLATQKFKPAKRHVRSRLQQTEHSTGPAQASPTRDEAPLQYVDLFAGCGGLSTGLHLAGWKGLFAIERNPTAFSTLKANLIDKRSHFKWPEWLEAKSWDIKDLLATKADELTKLSGTIDLIAGGPPCQGFSSAGRRQESDERNNLVHSYLDVVEMVKPKVIFLENVRGFASKFKARADAGATYSEVVVRKLRELGYEDAQGKLIDMSRYGLPQRRLRFIIIATLDGYARKIFRTLGKGRKTFLYERGIAQVNTASSALSDLLQAHGEKDCPDFEGFMSGTIGRARTGLQVHLRSGMEAVYTPDSHRFVQHREEAVKVFQLLLDTAPRNKRLFGKNPNACGLKKRSVTILGPGKPAPTVTSLPDDSIHYFEPRVMTVRECARLQTFPDWFEFKGRYTAGGKERSSSTPRYTQVGNAVPPLFAEMVGQAIKEVLSNG